MKQKGFLASTLYIIHMIKNQSLSSTLKIPALKVSEKIPWNTYMGETI